MARKIAWRLSTIDWEGPFGWSGFNLADRQELLDRLSALESNTWAEIFLNAKKHNHRFLVSAAAPEVARRLRDLEMDDQDELHSIKVCGKKRIIGIFDGQHFKILWWDPEHRVCPCEKKHT